MNKVYEAASIFLVAFTCAAYAQKSTGGRIIPIRSYDSVPAYKLSPDILLKSKQNLKSMKDVRARNIYAYPVDVYIDIVNEGKLTILHDGRKVWRYIVESEGASSLSLIFSSYQLMKGSKLMIYTPDQSKILGAFTEDNNKPFGSLAVSPVATDKLVIELQAPSEQKFPGHLVLGVIGHGFEKTNQEALDGYYGTSRDCNVDINCMSDTTYQIVKRAVCRIFYGSIGACTGTLINNSSLDGTPYIITANHCFDTEYLANNAVFHFNYESPYCDGPDSDFQSISGSELISTSHHLDYTLVKLSEIPAFNYDVYYAGWNVEDDITDSVFTIHHPRKDVKKISFSEDRPYIGNWGNGYDPYVHWVVEEYNFGTTEIFSSGAPLFNKHGEISGVLSGGILDTCGFVYDNFQRLYNAYDDYSYETQQLKHWINPLNVDIESLEGYDPYENFKLFGEQLTHFTSGDDTLLHQLESGWGYLTGHNSGLPSSYAEKFEFKGNKYLIGAYIYPMKVYNHYDSSGIRMKVWEGTSEPGEVVREKFVYYYQMAEEVPLFIQFDSAVFMKNSFFIGFDLFYNAMVDTFAMGASAVSENAEINTSYKYENGLWQPVVEDSSLTLAIFPLVYDYEKSILKPFEEIDVDKVFLYPLPARDELYMFFDEEEIASVDAELYDMSGRLLISNTYIEPARNISLNLFGIKAGQYILKLSFNDEKIIRKVVVLN